MPRILKINKWIKGILITLLVVTSLLVASYLLLVTRFKEILNYVVKTETNGQYQFHAAKVNISVWTRNVRVQSASLIATDTTNTSPHYSLDIKKLNLNIHSLKDLLFSNTMVVDSLVIEEPEISIHVHDKDTLAAGTSVTGTTAEASDVIEILNKVSSHLQLKSLRVINASLKYATAWNTEPFIANRINLTISDFRKKDSIENDLLYTDDIDLSLYDQQWTLPGGDQKISFTKFHYSAKDQFVELDSCTITMKGEKEKGDLSIYSDQLRFTPRKLQEHLNKNELVIDSLICIRPVLVIHKAAKKIADTTAVISSAMHHVFGKVNFKYVDVVQGSFEIFEQGATKAAYTTQLADLKLYNLGAPGNPGSGINIDSVKLKLSNLRFVTKDSLYQLTVSEFSMRNNDLIFLNAVYGNTPQNKKMSNLSFSTPFLKFRSINLEALLNKKLTAPSIELQMPKIHLYAQDNKKTATDSISNFSMDEFYQTLHGLTEIINVDSFYLVRGNIYLDSKNNKLKARFLNVDGTILINNVLKSDSLLDIKKAIIALSVDTMAVVTPALRVNASKFAFTGSKRSSSLGRFNVLLQSGSSFSGTRAYWERFDWDMLLTNKKVQIRKLNIDELFVDVRNTAADGPVPDPKKRELPPLMIGHIDINKLNLSLIKKNNSLTVAGRGVSVSNLHTNKNHFKWDNLLGTASEIYYSGNDISINTKEVLFNTSSTSLLHSLSFNVKIKNQKFEFTAPLLKLDLRLSTTDLSRLMVKDISSQSSNIVVTDYKSGKADGQKITDEVYGKSSQQKQNKGQSSFSIGSVSFKNNVVTYQNSTDSITAGMSMDIAGKDFTIEQDIATLISYDKLKIALQKIELKKPGLFVRTKNLDLALTNGKLTKTSLVENRSPLEFRSAVEIRLANADAWINSNDSSELRIEKLSGSLVNNHLEIESGEKTAWTKLLKYIIVQNADIAYQNKNIAAGLNSFHWNGPGSELQTGGFFVKPKLSLEEDQAGSSFQKDYLSLTGKSLDANGINYHHRVGDSMLSVRSLTINGINLSTTRDKRYPFRHGIEKLMPTALIRRIKFPFLADSILITDGAVVVNEISSQTKKTGSIPLSDIQAVITNVGNRKQGTDALRLSLNAKVLDNRINKLDYREYYNDTLSRFEMSVNASTMTLTNFSRATIPLANVAVTNGRSDTLFASWTGNKYAAAGRMNFHYKKLKVALLDKDDPERKKFHLKIINFLANGVLKNSNDKEAVVFYKRDREKFVFNYWVKTTLSGLMTTAGVKSNKKYLKQYNRIRVQYALPSLPVKNDIETSIQSPRLTSFNQSFMPL